MKDQGGGLATGLSVLALAPALSLLGLMAVAPGSELAAQWWRPLLSACGATMPVAVLLALVGLAQGARGRALVALALFVPALAGPMLAVRQMRAELPAAVTSPASAWPGSR